MQIRPSGVLHPGDLLAEHDAFLLKTAELLLLDPLLRFNRRYLALDGEELVEAVLVFAYAGAAFHDSRPSLLERGQERFDVLAYFALP